MHKRRDLFFSATEWGGEARWNEATIGATEWKQHPFIFEISFQNYSCLIQRREKVHANQILPQTKRGLSWPGHLSPLPQSDCELQTCRVSISISPFICIIKSRQRAVSPKRGSRCWKLEVPVIHASWEKSIVLQFIKKKKKKRGNLISVWFAWLKSNQNSPPQLLHGNHVSGCCGRHCPAKRRNKK